MSAIGGQFEIASVPEAGTRIQLSLHLPPD